MENQEQPKESEAAQLQDSSISLCWLLFTPFIPSLQTQDPAGVKFPLHVAGSLP